MSQICFALERLPHVPLQLLQSGASDANIALRLQGSADPAGHRQQVLCKGYESAHNGLEMCHSCFNGEREADSKCSCLYDTAAAGASLT